MNDEKENDEIALAHADAASQPESETDNEFDMDDDEEMVSPDEVIARFGAPVDGIDDVYLSGIDGVKWAELDHAYGSAADVPPMLRALTSPLPGFRPAAEDMLFGSLWHQGSVYPATPIAIPFLNKLLAHPAVRVRATVLQLLMLIRTGEAEDYKPSIFLDSVWTLARWPSAAQIMIQIRHAVDQGASLYLELARSENSEIANAAIELLTHVTDCQAPAAQVVFEQLSRASDATQRESLFVLLDQLLPVSRDAADAFFKLQTNESDTYAKAICAVASWRRHADYRVTSAVIVESARLVDDELVKTSGAFDSTHYLQVFRHENKILFLASALAEQSDIASTDALLDMLDTLRDPDASHDTARILLSQVFPKLQKPYHSSSGPTETGGYAMKYSTATTVAPCKRDTLTGQALRAIRAIVRCDPFWEVESNLLAQFGLPGLRENLRDFAA